MRIAINGLFWDKPFTGSGMYLRQLWRYLPTAPGEHQFVMLRPVGEREQTTTRLNARAIDAPVAPFPVRGERPRQVIWEQVGLPMALGRVASQVLHCPYLAAPLLGRRSKLVITVHDVIPWALPDYMSSGPMRLYLALARQIARGAPLLLTDSEHSRRDIVKYFGIPQARIRVITLGAEPELFHHASPAQLGAVRARLGLPERYAFYIGGFDQRKNVTLLLRAWAAALPELRRLGEPEPTLVIGGNVPSPGGIIPTVMAEAQSLGLLHPDGKAAVRFVGRVSEEDKHALLAGSRMFLFPSLYEGFGYDPLEAMATGAPLICSNSSSLPEVVGDAGLLLSPNDAGVWSAAITDLWFDDAHRQELAAAGPRRAAEFKPQETAWKTLKAYGDVARERQRDEIRMRNA